MSAYYNENDPKAAAWLRALIAEGHIAPGYVDERSILDVKHHELSEYTQCHFFAGIGGWSYAIRLAGVSDAFPIWTGSCPCQPLSCAGQRKGHADERHLWPTFYALIAKRQPSICFGEQIASADGREWFAGVRADLEGIGYAVGVADLCAACVRSPQVRQRLFWVSHTKSFRPWTTKPGNGAPETNFRWSHPPSSDRRFTDSFGNSYRIPESEIPFLDDGFPGILDRIRAAGNAIVPQVAAEFIQASLEAIGEHKIPLRADAARGIS